MNSRQRRKARRSRDRTLDRIRQAEAWHAEIVRRIYDRVHTRFQLRSDERLWWEENRCRIERPVQPRPFLTVADVE